MNPSESIPAPLQPVQAKSPRRKRKYALTPRALAACRANLAKARSAPKHVRYPQTEKRRAASRANMLKAIAARKSPEGNAAARLNALKHGLSARRVEESIRRLRENPEEFRKHLRLFERAYLPEDELERKLVRRLADTAWRRLRLFRAHASWEAKRLRKALDLAPPAEKITAEETEVRALALVGLLLDYHRVFEEGSKLHSQIEFLLRALLRKRSGGGIEFKGVSPRRDSRNPEFEGPDIGVIGLRILKLKNTEEGREFLRKTLREAGITTWDPLGK